MQHHMLLLLIVGTRASCSINMLLILIVSTRACKHNMLLILIVGVEEQSEVLKVYDLKKKRLGEFWGSGGWGFFPSLPVASSWKAVMWS
jgi:hypothetical protein